ncbi:unknown protein [Seminavis robusta]|uniref:EGF-like domain-containing protein n=1 Tax=Seminavis robusta TaxID=568900 RepID=A0A9N8HZY5_9STRA|nr:unknown protein [Seminavis robusta]|eukprot:Sro2424_g327250.1 n/a (1412) ;mRNA; f:7846-12255
MTLPNKNGVGMTLPPTNKEGQSNPLLTVTDEVDVDSLRMDLEQPKESPTEGFAMARSSSLTLGTGVSTIMDSLSPKDLATLASLLKPLLKSHDNERKSTDLKPFRTHGEIFSIEDENEDKDKDEAEWHNPFGASTYSLIYLCSVDSVAFWYAIFVYVIQITTILLTLIDIVDWSGNGLDMPPNVDLIVTIAQGVALFQAVAFQSDLLEVVGKFKGGFHPEVLERHPGATYSTWLLSCIAQLMAGLLLLLTIYILTMQVDSVLGIMLNFAALHFMADIDNVAFDLAKAGFMGNRLQSAANNVVNFQVRKPSGEQGFLQRSWKAGVFLSILAVMVAGWITIVVFRTSGKYMCNTIIVNMGDEFVPSLGTFNGLYDLDFSTGSGLEWRAEYAERRSAEIDTPGRGVFGYCNDIKAWTFRVQPKDNLEGSDPCDWIARSSETDTYDITETGRIQWFVRDETNREVVLEPLSVFCFDCANEDAEGTDDCGGKGSCSNAVCDCEDGWYGLRCEFVSPCPWITIDARKEKFASTRDWASNYQFIELGDSTLVEAYHRPVYIHEYESGEYDVVMFTGGRWALTSSVFLSHTGRIPSDGLSEGQDDVGDDIGNFFKYSFHGFKGFSTNFSVAFLSDYMEIGTERDSSSPVGLSWYDIAKEATAEDENQGTGSLVDAEFLCHVCDSDSNPCLYDGKCNNGTCECNLDSFGSLCEDPPGMHMHMDHPRIVLLSSSSYKYLLSSMHAVNNGHCDPFFNTPKFNLDGGDCCESTCVSTSQYVCGAEEDGYVSTGYFYCEQPKGEWQQDSEFNGDTGASSGFAMDLSRGAMAVTVTALSVSIYDKVGSSWVLRDTLIGPATSDVFGWNVALSSGLFHVASNPSFRPPLTVVVQDFIETIYIYKCFLSGCTQTQQIPLVSAFDLSDDGTVLATSLRAAANQAPKVIQVYEAQERIFEFRANVTIARNGNLDDVYSLSLSEDGSKLAVQSQASVFDSKTNSGLVTDEYIVLMAWDELTGEYVQEIEFRFESDEKTMDHPLSLALNQDGTVLAYGFPKCQGTQLHIFNHNDAGVWVPQRTPEMNNTGCIESSLPISNNALAVSGDGSMIAFRVGDKVRVYSWEAEFWHALGDEFPFSQYAVAMSPDGTEIAIGSPGEGIGGVTSVYLLPGRKECPTGMSLLRLSLTLGSTPNLLGWNLVNNSTGEILFEQNSNPREYPDGYNYATIVEETCVPADSCYVFTIHSMFGRGLSAPGQYAIFMDGENVSQGTFNGLFAREQFGSCASCPTGTERFGMMMLTCGPMELVLLKLIDQGENGVVLHSDDTFDGNYDDTVYETCGEHFPLFHCTEYIPVSHGACLDPTECYGVHVRSPRKYTADLELVFGEQRVNADYEEVCDGQTFFVGNKDKCNQKADWQNQQAPGQNVSQTP